MGCPNARAGVKIVKKKANQILTPPQTLITTSGVAIGVALVVPILVGWSSPPGADSKTRIEKDFFDQTFRPFYRADQVIVRYKQDAGLPWVSGCEGSF